MKLCVVRLLILPVLALGLLRPAMATVPKGVASVTTQVDGNKTDLFSLTMNDGRTASPGHGLTGISIFDWNTTSATSGQSVTFLSPDVVASTGRPALLDGDAALNTGLLGPGGSGGLALGVGPIPLMKAPNGVVTNPGTNGLGINFTVPLVNGPGDDVVLFDWTSVPAQAGDTFFVSALIGGSGYASHSAGFRVVTSLDYSVKGAVRPARTYTENNPVASLSDLQKSATASPISFTGGYHAVSFDLSDLGVALGGSATGLFIQSTTLHPVFIAGLTTLSVPEPSAATLLGMGLTIFLATRIVRRGAHPSVSPCIVLLPTHQRRTTDKRERIAYNRSFRWARCRL